MNVDIGNHVVAISDHAQSRYRERCYGGPDWREHLRETLRGTRRIDPVAPRYYRITKHHSGNGVCVGFLVTDICAFRVHLNKNGNLVAVTCVDAPR